jgi:tetratricopeptide (TPR) repeat protein
MLLLVPFLLWFGPVLGQTAEALLHQADTLFRARRYTESLRTYEQILQGSGQATPAMLLRMAFIEEGLGRYTEALYYLNLYYRRQPRQAVAVKMEDMAARYNLAGYQFSDLDFFFIWYDRYYDYLMVACCCSASCCWPWRRAKSGWGGSYSSGTAWACSSSCCSTWPCSTSAPARARPLCTTTAPTS